MSNKQSCIRFLNSQRCEMKKPVQNYTSKGQKNIFQKEKNPIANENQLFIYVVHADLF